MRKLVFEVILPDLLHAELIENCETARIPKNEFAAQCVEATLAARRLPKVEPGPLGARLQPPEKKIVDVVELP